MVNKTLPGFMSRAAAQRKYGRSKSSFIRDVDEAFSRGDTEFLSHFKVLLNNGQSLEGRQATKTALQQLQSKQPRWFIDTMFLESRYWDRGARESNQVSDAPSATQHKKKQRNKTTDEQLQHELDLAQQQIDAQRQTIDALNQDKAFLQSELENRRGEIDKLRGFFESVGDAADSAARLKQGNTTAKSDTVTHRDTQFSLMKHLPTLNWALDRFRKY